MPDRAGSFSPTRAGVTPPASRARLRLDSLAEPPERFERLFPSPPVSIDITDVAGIRVTQCP